MSVSPKKGLPKGTPIENASGRIYNDWKVIRYDFHGKWLCECKCGRLLSIKLHALKNNKTRRCYKCYDVLKITTPLCGKIIKYYWDGTKRGAKDRGLSFDLTPQQAWELFESQNGKCFYSGRTLNFASHSKTHARGEWNASLDRTNSSEGYHIGNVRWVDKKINMMKTDYPLEKFIACCLSVNEWQKSNRLLPNYQPRVFKKHHYWSGCGELSGFYWGGVKDKANIRGLDFKITIEQAWELFLAQGGICNLTGVPLTLAITAKEHRSLYQTASLDRMDCNRGYTLDNIQWLHKSINIMKKDLPQDEFISLCFDVANYNGTRFLQENRIEGINSRFIS